MNKIRLFITLTALAASSISIYAQKWESIENDERYYWAEGTGETAEEANQNALKQVTDQISVSLEKKYEEKFSEHLSNDSKSSYNWTKENKIRSFSMVVLNNCKSITIKNTRNKCVVLRYIEKDEVEKVIKTRKDKIMEFLEIAIRSEQEMKLDDALRYFYWAQALLYTLPFSDINSLSFGENEERRICSVWIPHKIEEILDNICFSFNSFSSENQALAELDVMYRGKPIASLDYTYFDGFDMSNVIGAKNGRGVIELRTGAETKSINVTVEYAYKREAMNDPDMRSVLENVKIIPYKEAFKGNISISSTKGEKDKNKSEMSQEPDGSRFVNEIPGNADMEKFLVFGEEKKTYEEIVSRVIRGLTSNSDADISDCFTSEGFDIYNKLLRYGNAKVMNYNNLKFLKLDNHIYCRAVPMLFSFPGNSTKFLENVVFDFEKGKICNLTFALEDTSIEDVRTKTRWQAESKVVLINFLENYKTSFALKRLDYISSIFSNDALIITGRVLKVADVENQILGKDEIIKYTRQTKSQYISNLERSFCNKSYIKLKFSNLKLLVLSRGTNKNVFSVQLRQDYFSSNYSDSGYLFLLVDLDDYRHPVIHVRTWQEKPDEKFGVLGPEDDIYN